MKTYKVYSKSDEEIIFMSQADLMGFFDDVSNGAWCVVEYTDGKTKRSELLSPDISALIRDNKLTIRSEEKVK